MMRMLGIRAGFEFNSPENTRDVQYLGACDDSFMKLAELLGWEVCDSHCLVCAYFGVLVSFPMWRPCPLFILCLEEVSP